MMNKPDPARPSNTAVPSSSSLQAVPVTPSKASASGYSQAVSAAARGSDRRNSYRCPCNLPCTMEQHIAIRDVSLGGAALMLPFSIPVGTAIVVNLPSQDALLRGLKAHVVSSSAGPDGTGFEVHLKFEMYPLNVQKSMVRFLMEVQVKKSRP